MENLGKSCFSNLSASLMKSDLPGLLWIDFNQDASCIILGSEQGLCIFRIEPLKKLICCARRETTKTIQSELNAQGGLGIVEMIYRTNLLALVGGGLTPKFPTNKVKIWDDHARRSLLEFEFHSQVVGLKLNRSRYFHFESCKI
jgi:hypothetical protein